MNHAQGLAQGLAEQALDAQADSAQASPLAARLRPVPALQPRDAQSAGLARWHAAQGCQGQTLERMPKAAQPQDRQQAGQGGARVCWYPPPGRQVHPHHRAGPGGCGDDLDGRLLQHQAAGDVPGHGRGSVLQAGQSVGVRARNGAIQAPKPRREAINVAPGAPASTILNGFAVRDERLDQAIRV